MPPFHQFSLPNVDIGGGLRATTVWWREDAAPIVLVGTVDRSEGQERKSRLDLQKHMFIDPLPGERSADGVSNLVRSVAAATAATGH